MSQDTFQFISMLILSAGPGQATPAQGPAISSVLGARDSAATLTPGICDRSGFSIEHLYIFHKGSPVPTLPGHHLSLEAAPHPATCGSRIVRRPGASAATSAV